ncbi:hypothetical protein Bca52824_089697 [Brassica carinata]|uniref:Uncharacterized protein n=1 Tax=Brassica carinata TaxID=52824 RepID=A0A8X7PCW3_BRACI|nr:hypothetical protein Bca52824_089697 [Brassica carinata]
MTEQAEPSLTAMGSSVPYLPDHDEEVTHLDETVHAVDISIDTQSLPPLITTHETLDSVPISSNPFSVLSPSSPEANQTIQFSSSPTKASFVFGIPATYAPTFGSYITTKQAAAFNAPSITLPPQFTVPSCPPLLFPGHKKTNPSYQPTIKSI